MLDNATGAEPPKTTLLGRLLGRLAPIDRGIAEHACHPPANYNRKVATGPVADARTYVCCECRQHWRGDANG